VYLKYLTAWMSKFILGSRCHRLKSLASWKVTHQRELMKSSLPGKGSCALCELTFHPATSASLERRQAHLRFSTNSRLSGSFISLLGDRLSPCAEMAVSVLALALVASLLALQAAAAFHPGFEATDLNSIDAMSALFARWRQAHGKPELQGAELLMRCVIGRSVCLGP